MGGSVTTENMAVVSFVVYLVTTNQVHGENITTQLFLNQTIISPLVATTLISTSTTSRHPIPPITYETYSISSHPPT
jgi:hypothetical protein